MSHIRFFVSGVFEYAKDRGLFGGENPAGAALPEGLKPGKPGEAYSLEDLNTMLTVLQETRDNKSCWRKQCWQWLSAAGCEKGNSRACRGRTSNRGKTAAP